MASSENASALKFSTNVIEQLDNNFVRHLKSSQVGVLQSILPFYHISGVIQYFKHLLGKLKKCGAFWHGARRWWRNLQWVLSSACAFSALEAFRTTSNSVSVKIDVSFASTLGIPIASLNLPCTSWLISLSAFVHEISSSPITSNCILSLSPGWDRPLVIWNFCWACLLEQVTSIVLTA